MERYVCPPWYECRCILGKPVSRSTMLSHCREANKKRAELGLGAFALGRKVPAASTGIFLFSCLGTITCHPSDVLGRAGRFVLRVRLFVWETLRSNSSDENPNDYVSNEGVGWNHLDPRSPDPRNGQCRVQPDLTSSLNDRDDDGEELQIQANAFVRDEVDRPETSSTAVDETDIEHSANGSILETPENHVEYEDYEGDSGGTPEIDETHSDSGNDQEQDQLNISTDGRNHILDHNSSQPQTQMISNHMQESSVFQGNAELLPWLFENSRWVDLYTKYALPEAVMDEILDILSMLLASNGRLISNVRNATGTSADLEVYASCHRHIAFVPDPFTNEMPERCSECDSSMPLVVESQNRYLYLPVLPRLLSMISKADACEKLYAYRKSRVSDAGILRDYFDGDFYQATCEQLGGPPAVADDIFILALLRPMDSLHTKTVLTTCGLFPP